jgi:uracil-DNA glycosylase family 4
MFIYFRINMTNRPNELQQLQQEVIACRKCTRLIEYRRELAQKIPRRFQGGSYWSKPPTSLQADDGLTLKDAYITATIRCAPPQNKPLPKEVEACRRYLQRELGLLARVRVFIPLGQVAFQQLLKNLRMKGAVIPALKFGHGQVYPLPDGRVIVTSYHPSQQNTFTGKLTRPMFYDVFEKGRELTK